MSLLSTWLSQSAEVRGVGGHITQFWGSRATSSAGVWPPLEGAVGVAGTVFGIFGKEAVVLWDSLVSPILLVIRLIHNELIAH